MGEIADGMVSGASCSWCGLPFADEHGFPVLCPECFNGASKRDRAGLQKAFIPLVQTFKRSVDKLAIILGMQAENDQRKAIGASMAYHERDFASVL